MANNAHVVVEVIEALAEADRVKPEELDYTLFDYVDTDVLVHLTEMEDSTWTFSFQITDHEVTLLSDGRLFIDGTLSRENILSHHV